jgi:hypothetical protein
MRDAELLPPVRDDFEESYAWYLKRIARAAERFTVPSTRQSKNYAAIRVLAFGTTTNTSFIG